MFPNVGYVTGRLREARDVTGRLREVGRIPVKRVEEVSEPLREPGIITGYRHENCSVIQAVASLFNATNETVNFWTHFLASVYFAWLLVSLSTIMPLFDDPYLYPLTCYFIASCCYPLMSCLAHAFSCLSLTATHVCFFIDYLAISMYSWAVAYLYYSYCFPPQLMNTWLSQVYLPVAAVNAVLATLCASLSRFIHHSVTRKILRVAAFVKPFIWDSLPLVLWLYTCDTSGDSCEESRSYHLNQFACVFIALFFYGSHIPERLAPGCFDFVGHSHNILHVFSILGTNEQMRAVLIDLKNRRADLEVANWIPSPIWATQVTPSLLLCNIFLVLTLTYFLSRQMQYSHKSVHINLSCQPHCTTVSPNDHLKEQ
ncbi:membrane progestin receptor gamma-like [Homarus americanus]|uniref:membrane progestin receptor gamma-like n=1 Tax=Homarus americanus TaxID=6706 RepID=UPI001C46EE9F|nr:membrane progestin receptor gamma-like [Homarus americanus]XP_042230865.1 membrane progestin receptor gamma-like [Homarus americanus]